MKRIIAIATCTLVCICFIGCTKKIESTYVDLNLPGLVDGLYYKDVATFEFQFDESGDSYYVPEGIEPFGKIRTAKQAALCAENLSLRDHTVQEVYGQKPFEVYYNAEHTVWRVVATHDVLWALEGPCCGGGGIDLLLDAETGEVISMWYQD
jgi:hypothetical protein